MRWRRYPASAHAEVHFRRELCPRGTLSDADLRIGSHPPWSGSYYRSLYNAAVAVQASIHEDTCGLREAAGLKLLDSSSWFPFLKAWSRDRELVDDTLRGERTFRS